MHERLLIIGAKGHGKVVADIALRTGSYKDIAFLDDDTSIKETMHIPVVGNSEDVGRFKDISDLFVAIGNPVIRRRMLERLWTMGIEVPVLIHPRAIIGGNVSLGSGTVVMAGAVINPDTQVGRGCIINTCASVDHDCVVEDFVHIAVGAHLAGNVRVERSTWIGAGSIVKNNLNICSECMVGAGAVVVKNIEEIGTYVGVPATKMDQQIVFGGVNLYSAAYYGIIRQAMASFLINHVCQRRMS